MRDFPTALEFTEQSEQAEAFVVKLAEEIAYWGDVIHCPDEADKIESQSRDGFIAWTNGGFEIVAMASLSAAQGSGDIPVHIQPYLDQAQKDCEADFCRHRDIDPEAFKALGDDETGQALLEEFWDYENDYMNEGGEYFYKMRAAFYEADNYQNESGVDEVLLAFFINTDFTYGRDKANITIWSETIAVADFTEARMQEAFEAAWKAISNS